VDNQGPNQRYKEFNRARADFYEDITFLDDWLLAGVAGPAFPASTGIGTRGQGIRMSALAVASPRREVVAVPLENPRQTPAYRYAARYSPQRPRFSRGMALCCGPDTVLFVSGTASIAHAETRHPEDVVAQTEEILENIAALISEENLDRHNLRGSGTSLDGLGLIRVYIKRPWDYARVRGVCQRRLGAVPATYLVADVCRPDLLVEIEGIAFGRAAPSAAPLAGRYRCIRPAPVCPECGEKVDRGPYCLDSCPELHICPYAVLRP